MSQNLKERAKSAKPSYAKLMHGYLGFLTGRGKSLATISSYKTDLEFFERFLDDKKRNFYTLQARDFEAYLYWMERKGLKMNTKRRKIISAKALVKYAVSRKKMTAGSVQFVKTPDRLERLPWIPTRADFGKILSCLPAKTPLGLRNRLVVILLAETGLTVAEVCSLKWDQWEGDSLHLAGKKPRKIRLEKNTLALLRGWRSHHEGKHFFPGFNRHGITSEKMTTRGVELFFRHLARASGYRSLKPKTLRHFAIAHWLTQNISETEIQTRLGVHKNYSLDAYRKFLETK